MTEDEKLRRLIAFALPKSCYFAEENFAGDPHVRAFCDYVRARCEVELHVFVAWACPPEVKCLPSKRAIVRSERFDTLIVEYCRLREGYLRAPAVLSVFLASSVLRWMSEMLIGYRQPDLAIHALARRHDLPTTALTTPFRDEAFASLPELERTALQCFCLGHEVGHFLVAPRTDVTLQTLVDGCSLSQHIDTEERLQGIDDDKRFALAEIRKEKLDAARLLNEIEVDLFAFRTLVAFLHERFSAPFESIVRSALLSVEAQSFVYACKSGCRLLSLAAEGTIVASEFLERAYLAQVELAVRARTLVRHAGIVWATVETPRGARDYNAYVKKIDTMLSSGANFTTSMATVLAQQEDVLLAELEANAGELREPWRAAQRELLENDGELRLDAYNILIAFGCSGAVDPIAYLQNAQPGQRERRG